MQIVLQTSVPWEREEMAGIFNHYVEHSFATYTETPVTPERFNEIMDFHAGWPVVTARTVDGLMAGFGLLRPYSPIAAFSRTAEITCFIRPGFTGMGIGSEILAELESGARKLGIETILATVSSLNDRSVRFHEASGFRECGRLPGIGRKRGETFDVVLLQKSLITPLS